MIKYLAAILIAISSISVQAQSDITGYWKTIDDNTGEERSVIEIYKKDDLYFGKISRLLLQPEDDPNPLCNECDEDDDRYKQPILDMEILRGLKMEDDIYTDGEVLDPENGSVYRCKVWLENGDLMLRGYVAFFFRTQKWKKISEKNN